MVISIYYFIVVLDATNVQKVSSKGVGDSECESLRDFGLICTPFSARYHFP